MRLVKTPYDPRLELDTASSCDQLRLASIDIADDRRRGSGGAKPGTVSSRASRRLVYRGQVFIGTERTGAEIAAPE